MWLLLFFVCVQELDLSPPDNWETMARPWMTLAETRLYDGLSNLDRQKFKGFFVARRLEQPEQWPKTGLYLPEFFCDKRHGDVRDQIRYVLGEPEQVEAFASTPELPAQWRYAAQNFRFERQGGRVRLTSESRQAWDQVLQARVKHPDLRYDFQVASFGRTHLDEDLAFETTTVAASWVLPETKGGTWHVTVAIPDAFKQYVRRSQRSATQNMELLVRLKRPGDVVGSDGESLRHDARKVHLLDEDHVSFEVFLPEGYFDAELNIYSGFLERGLKTQTNVAVRPLGQPRISDPIICQEWVAAGITVPTRQHLAVGNIFYKPVLEYDSRIPARVLVQSPLTDTRLWLQTRDGNRVSLKHLAREDGWFTFELPQGQQDFRLIALGFQENTPAVALGVTGPPVGTENEDLVFKQNGQPNYLGLERLEVVTEAPLTLLLVNGVAVAASQNGTFAWQGMDWGKTATFRFEYEHDGSWQAATFKMRRSGVYERLEVRPRYVVAATRRVDGLAEDAPIEVNVVGRKVEVVKRTPYSEIPQLWGIVVNDPLLMAPSWPSIRNVMLRWIKQNTGPRDLIYVVQNANRPELVLAPTAEKTVVHAAIESLQPQTRNANYFTVQYLIDALVHSKWHETRPHQVLLMTNQLTDEVSQMEDLLPRLRATGLQLYNVEIEFDPTSALEQQLADNARSDLEEMAITEEKRRLHRTGLRNSIQDDKDDPTLLSFTFGKRKADREARRETVREEAFRSAFNRQLATLTAGLSNAAGVGEVSANLNRFFTNLTAWQKGLVHLELSVPYLEEDLVQVRAPAGFSAGWTLVQWHPDEVEAQ